MATKSMKRPAAAFVSPDARLSDRMKVSKDIVDELLLVCGVIGTTTEGDELVPVTDCLNWLQDLQRALRRDDDLYRPISLLLSQWKIVEQKLLPLVLTSRYDPAIVLTVCKILVILTKPLSDQTLRAGRGAIRTKPKSAVVRAAAASAGSKGGERSIDITEEHEELQAKKRAAVGLSKAAFESVKQEQISIRDNAIQQANALVDYKQAICKHANQSQGDGVLSIFISLLADPLSRTGNARTDSDHLTIEVVLHLFRNLLAADPLVKTPQSEKFHHEFVIVLQRELVLDIFLVLAADIERRENAQYNLLLMELLQHLLRHQDPTMVAQSQHYQKPVDGALLGSLNRQRNAMKSQATSRHSHFGGTLVVGTGNNGKRLLNAGRADEANAKAPVLKRQKDVFVGASNRVDNHRRSRTAGPTEQKSAKVIHSFCKQFVASCYGPVMKSLKNEFRRDSARLEAGDRVVFFRIASFFCQWWRASKREHGDTPAENGLTVGHLIFTMDLYTFNLVLNSTDTFFEHKMYPSLVQAVALLREMMHLLQTLYFSKLETEKVIALGLMEHLFYNTEPLDRLPKLLSRWAPGIGTRDYLCDLLHISHLSLKILDSFSAECQVKKADENVTMSKKKALAARFHVPSYFAKKIVSNLSVTAFTHLLASYDANSTTVNHRLVTFFTRLSKHVISSADTPEDGIVNPLAARTVTYEPMLYNYQMIQTLGTILNDTTIRKDPAFTSLLKFASTLVYNFSVNAKKNPMLFVEMLLKQNFPHRYCEFATNMYVSEDMRLMVERDLLMDRHRSLDKKAAAVQRGDVESSDEEIEFEGEEEEPSMMIGKSKSKRVASTKRKDPPEEKGDSTDDDSDEEEDKNLLKAERERNIKKQKKDEELRKRIKELDSHTDDSSDDELLGGTLSIKSTTKSPSALLWDSDDE